MQYRPKQKTIEALEWNGENVEDFVRFINSDKYQMTAIPHGFLAIAGKQEMFDAVLLNVGDFLIRNGDYIESMPGAKFREQFEEVRNEHS